MNGQAPIAEIVAPFCRNTLRNGARGDVIQDNGWNLSLAEDLLGVKNLNAHEGFAGADVQGDLVVQPNRPTFSAS